MRTISQPTAARSSVCCTQASVSMVSQVIIDCTRMGFAPPMPTPPTMHFARGAAAVGVGDRGSIALLRLGGRVLRLEAEFVLLGAEGKSCTSKNTMKSMKPMMSSAQAVCTNSRKRTFTGLRRTASTSARVMWPPSSTGMGSRLMQRQVHIEHHAEPERHAPAFGLSKNM